MAFHTLPPLEILNQLFRYEPETGILFWKQNDVLYSSAMDRVSGKEAGSQCTNGYKKITFNYKYYLAHRIIWKIAYGEDPQYIDHINGIRNDNRLCNLRSVDYSQNNKNKKIGKNNKSGLTGVRFDNQSKKWKATIGHNKHKHHLGYFSNLDDAIMARKKAESEYNFSGSHGK